MAIAKFGHVSEEQWKEAMGARAAEALTLCALGIGALILSRRFGPLPAALYALLLANLARERIFLLPSGTLADIMKKKKTTQEV